MAEAARILDGDYEPRVDVDRLVPHPRNPRRGNVGKIEKLIRDNGFAGAVLAQRSTGFVLAGNHTREAAIRAGLKQVPVLWYDVDDDEALRMLLGDNAGSDDAYYEDPDLASILSELEASDRGLEGTGFTTAGLEALLDRLGAEVAPGATDPDSAPPKPEPDAVRSRLGEVYALGSHRLVVGDARDPDVIELALRGRFAAMTWTDPPYGVEYEGKTEDRLTIEGDDAGGLEQLLRAVLGNARTWTSPGGAFWVTGPSGPPGGPIFVQVLSDLRVWRQTIVWIKDQFVLGRQDYQHRFELGYAGEVPTDVELGASRLDPEMIFAGWKAGAKHQGPPDRRQDTVWEIPRPRASRDHPTMKPVALVERAVRNHTVLGDLVLDPFAGSGSTLIACHRAGRVAALVEKDPGYADVIVRRWEDHTGIEARLEEPAHA